MQVVAGVVVAFRRFVLVAVLCAVASPVWADGRAIVSDVRVTEHGVNTRFVMDLSAPVHATLFSLAAPYRVILDLPEVGWRLPARPLPQNVGLFRKVRYGLFAPGRTRVVIEAIGPFAIVEARYQAREGDKHYRLVIDIGATSVTQFRSNAKSGAAMVTVRAEGLPSKAQQPVLAAKPPSVPARFSFSRPSLKPEIADQLPLIVIDPGHGGSETGVSGAGGTYEKDITLSAAQEFGQMLEKTGRYRVILTRNHDVFIASRDRVTFARRADADLLVSLHAGSNVDKNIRGLSVFTLSERASDSAASELVERENKAGLIAGTDLSNETPEVVNIVIDLAQRETMNESARFAAVLVKELGRQTRLLRNAHRFAGFPVLKAPDVPSVLVEMGFLSNRIDETALLKRSYRKKLGTAFVRAVDQYFSRVEEAYRRSTESQPPTKMVRDLQTLLSQLGYALGPVDGILGRKTRNAIEAFRRDKGLVLTGKAAKTLGPAVAGDPELPSSLPKDITPPIIETPATITVITDSATIRGQVTDNDRVARVNVENRAVDLQADGTFTFTRYVPVSGTTVQIEAIDDWGNRSSKKVKLTRSNTDTSDQITFASLNPTKISGQSNRNAVALVIGIADYTRAPKAVYADSDASVFGDYARRALGIPQSRIKVLTNRAASFVDLKVSVRRWLRGRIDGGTTDVYVFYAGHGLAALGGEELYLLPHNGEPSLLNETSLLLNDLFEVIANAKPKSATIFLDTCYSGLSRGGDALLASARGILVKRKDQAVPKGFTVFSAASGEQISSGLDEAKHGLFSYFLMKGMEGSADANQDRVITAGELHAFVQKNVKQQAIRLGREQIPKLEGDADRVLVRW